MITLLIAALGLLASACKSASDSGAKTCRDGETIKDGKCARACAGEVVRGKCVVCPANSRQGGENCHCDGGEWVGDECVPCRANELLVGGKCVAPESPPTGDPPQPLMTGNLIINGDAEAATGSKDAAPVETPGWKPAGNATAVQYGTSGGYPVASDPGRPDRGKKVFVRRRVRPERSPHFY